MVYRNKENMEAGDYPEAGESRTLLIINGDVAKIEGKLTVSKSIEIDCEVNGELEVDGELIIQKNGHVNADVKAVNAQIMGKYEGNMEVTDAIEIKDMGEVNGNIKTDSLIINKGGIFCGNVTRISDLEESRLPEEEIEEEVLEEEDKEEEEEINLESTQDDDDDLEL